MHRKSEHWWHHHTRCYQPDGCDDCGPEGCNFHQFNNIRQHYPICWNYNPPGHNYHQFNNRHTQLYHAVVGLYSPAQCSGYSDRIFDVPGLSKLREKSDRMLRRSRRICYGAITVATWQLLRCCHFWVCRINDKRLLQPESLESQRDGGHHWRACR